MNDNLEFTALAYRLLEGILDYADSPSQMNRRLVEQLRDLTAARLVVLVRQHDQRHELTAVEPQRRRALAESPAMLALAARTRGLDAPALWKSEDIPSEVAALLHESLPGPIVAIPLRVGGQQMGALLLFGLPDKHSLDQVIAALGVLSRVVALVLQKAALFEDQEATIAARTRQLAESEERLEVTLRSIGDAVIVTDVQGKVTLMNPIAEQLTGWGEAEALGKPLAKVFRIVNEQTRQPMEDPVARVLREGTVIGLANHTLLIARDGAEAPIADSGAPIRHASGEISGVVLVFRDQTRERAAQKALRESEEKFRRAILNAPFPIMLHAEDGEVIQINTVWEELTGYRAEEISTIADWTEKAYGGRKDLVRADIDRLYGLNARVEEGRYVITTHSGEKRTWEFSSAPLGRLPDQRRLVLSMAMDVSERVRVEQEVQKHARQQAVIAGLGQRALAGIELSSLMDEAVERVAETLPVDYCKVLELLPDGSGLLLRAGVGWQEGLVGRATVGTGLDSQAGYTLVSHEPVIVEDLRRETRFSGPPLLVEHRVISGMSVIIQGRDRPYGVLGAHTTRRQVFSEDDIHFLQAVANLLAEAIRRKRAEQALQTRTRQQQSLIEATRHLTENLAVDAVLQRIGQQAKAILDAYGCAIYLLEEDGSTLTPAVAIEPGIEEQILATPLPVDASLTGQAVQARRGLIFNQPSAHENAKTIPDTPMYEQERVLVAPLLIEDQVLGAMNLNRLGPLFSQDDLALAETYAAYAAIALKNARLYARVIQDAEEMEKRVHERTEELHAFVNLTAGRELRMAELKQAIKQLRAQLQNAGMKPTADDPLAGDG